jgi:plasmid stabilization system protein ParE
LGYKILFTEDALVDLEIILDYIRADNPDAANEFGTALLNHVGLLQAFPRIGAPVPRRPGIRKLLHTPIRVTTEFGKIRG